MDNPEQPSLLEDPSPSEMHPDAQTHLLNRWNEGPDSWLSFIPPCRMFNEILRLFKNRHQADLAEQWWVKQLQGCGIEGPFASSLDSFEPTKRDAKEISVHGA